MNYVRYLNTGIINFREEVFYSFLYGVIRPMITEPIFEMQLFKPISVTLFRLQKHKAITRSTLSAIFMTNTTKPTW